MVTTRRRLKVNSVAIPSPNSGQDTLILATLPSHSPLILLANSNLISLLTPSFTLIQSLDFNLAFPSSSISTTTVSALSFDPTTNRIAAASLHSGKVVIYEQSNLTKHYSPYSNLQKWRIHSTISLPSSAHQTTTSIDFKSSTLAIGGSGSISVWELLDQSGIPEWRRVGEEKGMLLPCGMVRLSPSAGILASFKSGVNFVRLSSILPSTTRSSTFLSPTPSPTPSTAARLHFLSLAWHALPILSISWRPTDSFSDSGPILFTTTRDNHFHIWGCMIDEPDFFSLWSTLSIGGGEKGRESLGTKWWRSEEMFPMTEEEPEEPTPEPTTSLLQTSSPAPSIFSSPLFSSSSSSLLPPQRQSTPIPPPPQKGRTEYFITIFSDSSIYYTKVKNFDRRPPTCLSQESHRLSISSSSDSGEIPINFLNHLRFTFLIPSTSSPKDFLLVGRSGRGGIIKCSFSFPQQETCLPIDSNITIKNNQHFQSQEDEQPAIFKFLQIPANFTGKIRKLVHGFMGESIMALGDSIEGLAQSWEVEEIGGREGGWVEEGERGGFGNESWEEREEDQEAEEVVLPSFVGKGIGVENGVKVGVRVAVWHDGKMISTLTSTRLSILTSSSSSSSLQTICSILLPIPLILTDIATFFVARTEEESLSTTLVAVILPAQDVDVDFAESEGEKKIKRKRKGIVRVRSWTFDKRGGVLRDGGEQALTDNPYFTNGSTTNSSTVSTPSSTPTTPTTPITKTLFALPLPIHFRSNIPNSSMTLVLLDDENILTFWRADIPDSIYSWRKRGSVLVGKRGQKERKEVVRVGVGVGGVTAIVSKTCEGKWELGIWDSKESEFTSGELHTQELLEPIIDMHWSLDGGILAVATITEVKLFCAMRLNDLIDGTPWSCFASVTIDSMTQEPINCISWLTSGMAIAAGHIVVFFSSKMLITSNDDKSGKVEEIEGKSCHKFARDQKEPLEFFHPQLLFQSLLHDRTEAVIHVLKVLASQLDSEGDLNPIETDSAKNFGNFDLAEFLKINDRAKGQTSSNGRQGGGEGDLFSRSGGHGKETLTEDETHKLLQSLKKCSLKGLTQFEHAHLAIVVQTVFDIQRQQGSLDTNGLKFFISMRSFYLYRAAQLPLPTTPTITASPRLKYRDAVWAFHSDSQDLLIDAAVKACPHKVLWQDAKSLSFFLWIKSPDLMSAQMEAIARAEYVKPDRDEKDPITASLFYLALRKKHMVVTLWKQAGGHTDQRNMVKLLANDFELPRWKSAALKNAFALISKQRFYFAAVFFLLGDSLKDAVNVCLRQLDDFQLAIAITRVYEGDDGPVLKSILKDTILPLAFESGFRWLASWAFWMLGRRDLAIQTIVTPLEDLAARLPYKLVSIGRPMHEDPCLVLLFGQLRSWSLQTLKGATTVSGRTEFNFLLHMARVLARMGCHILALDLLSSWEFIGPEPTPKENRIDHKFDTGTRRRSLRRGSTFLDLEIPSNLGSRAPSPEGEGGQQFHRILKVTKPSTAAPPEFSMDSFNF